MPYVYQHQHAPFCIGHSGHSIDLCFFELGLYKKNVLCNVNVSVLHEYPEEEKAFHCKLVCFIQTSKFQEGIQFLNKNSKLAS